MDLHRVIGDYRAHFHLEKDHVTIELRHNSGDYLLRTALQNGALPQSFLNIFEDVSDLYIFAQGKHQEDVTVVGNTLVLRPMTFKKKDIIIELTRVEVQGNKHLANKLDKLERKTDKLAQDVASLIPTLKQQFKVEIKVVTHLFNEEIKKLQNKIIRLEMHHQKKETNGYSKHQKPIQKVSLKGLAAEKIPRMTAPMTTSIRRKPYAFEVDQRSLYLEHYTIERNKITRKVEDQEIYMLSSSNPINKNGTIEIKMRINKITEGLIWIGLLCESKKGEQYIGEETGIIQLSLQGNRALVDGKIINLPFKQFKSGDTVEMDICLEFRQLTFYKNDNSERIYNAEISSSMLSQPIYPYVQMINLGDSVTFFD